MVLTKTLLLKLIIKTKLILKMKELKQSNKKLNRKLRI